MKDYCVTYISEFNTLFYVEARDEHHALEIFSAGGIDRMLDFDTPGTARIEVHGSEEDSMGDYKPLLVKRID